VEEPVPVKAGDRIRLGYSGPTVEIIAIALGSKPLSPSAKATGHAGATVPAAPQDLALLRGSLGAERMPIDWGGVIGRLPTQAHFVLEHAQVSRRHAQIRVDGGRVRLRDLGSANGTFVNGRRLTQPIELEPGDRIDIGPFSLAFDGEALVSRSRSNNIELAAGDLRQIVTDRATGQPLTLLDDVSLVVRPRDFVCLLGPSGSGKSTLLGILSGRNPPAGGSVRLNGHDLYANFAALKQDIAVVPQKEVVHDSLTVGSALGYTAELRLPPDTDREEIDRSVAQMLEVVGLTPRRDTLLRNLSGGQMKRAGLANELMARPSLLFLDEATNGLDEQTDRDMMELFRRLADAGKTVVCVTHSLANVEATCHRVVILTEGGRLAFIGTPEEARRHFGIGRLGDVYRRLAERPAAQWQADFRASPLYAAYVRDRMPASLEQHRERALTGSVEQPARPNPLRQAWILARRYTAIWRGDPVALATMLGQAVLVAVVLGAVFGRLSNLDNPNRAARTVNLLLLLNVACFWFGCNNAAKEIVKERVIYSRERDFNLRIDSYFASKAGVLGLIAIVQVSLLFGIVCCWCNPPGPAVAQWCILVALALAGTGLGLLISALARTEEVAAALVPLLVMPQIILAGVIAPLSGPVRWLAQVVITAYWGTEALQAVLPESELQALGIRPSSPGFDLAMIGLHLVVFTAATLIILWYEGTRRRG
jgi:ABC transport system ATP-binding/permease protein